MLISLCSFRLLQRFPLTTQSSLHLSDSDDFDVCSVSTPLLPPRLTFEGHKRRDANHAASF